MKRYLIPFIAAMALASAVSPALAFKGDPLPPPPCNFPIIFGGCLLRQVAESLELPVDEVVPSNEELDAQAAAAQQMQQEQMALAQKTEADKMLLEHKLDMDKEAAIAEREKESDSTKLISEVVKQAVQNAMQSSAEATKKAGKKLKYQYNDAGELVGGEVE